jgi:hypothetical protein
VAVPEQVVEALRHVARHLDVLHLVAADRHAVGVEQQDVGGHQDRVAVQPMLMPASGPRPAAWLASIRAL